MTEKNTPQTSSQTEEKKSKRWADTERTVQSHTSPFRLRQTFQEKF